MTSTAHWEIQRESDWVPDWWEQLVWHSPAKMKNANTTSNRKLCCHHTCAAGSQLSDLLVRAKSTSHCQTCKDLKWLYTPKSPKESKPSMRLLAKSFAFPISQPHPFCSSDCHLKMLSLLASNKCFDKCVGFRSIQVTEASLQRFVPSDFWTEDDFSKEQEENKALWKKKRSCLRHWPVWRRTSDCIILQKFSSELQGPALSHTPIDSLDKTTMAAVLQLALC